MSLGFVILVTIEFTNDLGGMNRTVKVQYYIVIDPISRSLIVVALEHLISIDQLLPPLSIIPSHLT